MHDEGSTPLSRDVRPNSTARSVQHHKGSGRRASPHRGHQLFDNDDPRTCLVQDDVVFVDRGIPKPAPWEV